jgi:hypothetical protein
MAAASLGLGHETYPPATSSLCYSPADLVVGNNRAAMMNFLSPATMAADNYFPAEFPPPAD